MSKIVILESSADLRERYNEAIAEGKIRDAVVVSSVDEAINAVHEDGVKVFRTNFINDDLPNEECQLYSIVAIQEALNIGVKVEIGTVMTRYEVEESFIYQGLENIFKDITVVNKYRKDYEFTVPGKIESSLRNERF